MVDNDLPVKKAEPVGFLQQYLEGMNQYQQVGSDIPSFGLRTDYAQQAGGPLVAESKSFEIPGARTKLTYPVLPSEDPDDVRLRMTYPVNQPTLPVFNKLLRGV